MLYIGIDPGKKGGIAYRCSVSGQYGAYKMPDTTKGILTIISELRTCYGQTCACIEQVQVMGKVFGAKAALSYGQGYGEIIGILTALGATIHEVRPSVWKRTLNVSSDKNSSILLCERLFPDIDLKPGRCQNAQDGLAEAALLVHYAEKMGLK